VLQLGVGGGTESVMADAPQPVLETVAEEGGGGEEVGSTLTMERVAAAKKFIENHYRAQTKNLQERRER
jgi:serine/threonine kinase 38